MKVKTDHAAGKGLRTKAKTLWFLAGVLMVLAVCSILLYRNPWIVHRMNADQANAKVLKEIADSRSPYIRIDGMNLTFTGYYKVSDDGKVCSYCYMGAVGDEYILADLPARDQGALAEDGSAEGAVLEDYTLNGQLVEESEMTSCLAEAEGMTLDAYNAYYHMIEVEVHDYDSDQERIRIYQLMLVILAAGAFATGWILLSESKIAEKETQDKDI